MIPAPMLAKLEEMADKEYLDASMALRRRFQDAFMSGACTSWELREGEVEAERELRKIHVSSAVNAERDRCAEIVRNLFFDKQVEAFAIDKILNPKAPNHD